MGHIGFLNSLAPAVNTQSSGDSTSAPASTAFVQSEIARLGRKKLAANTTFYVSTTGSDGNNGLTIGSPFATIQAAWAAVVSSYDTSGYTVTIQLADGTYSQSPSLSGAPVGMQGAGVIINGNSGTPGNVVLSGTLSVGGGAAIQPQNFRHNGGAGIAMYCTAGGRINMGGGLTFGASSAHIYCDSGMIVATAAYAIAGGANIHAYTDYGGVIYLNSQTVTLTGTPAFATAFASAINGSIVAFSMTFSGSATGTRYNVGVNGAIITNGGGASYFPGNFVGATATGGQYT